MTEKKPMPVSPAPRKFKIKGLTLDFANPRFGTEVLTEHQSINRLVNDSKSRTKLYALARDIMQRGRMNPAELPMVVMQGNRRIVAEGNRRVTALRLLQDPLIADSPVVRRRFQQIGAESPFEVPTELMCVPFGSWEEANPWIVLRHTGANGGVGVDAWDSAQGTRFAALHDPKKKASIQDKFQALLMEIFPDDEELLGLLSAARSSQNTTLGRLLLGRDQLELMGLAVFEDELLLITDEVTKVRSLFIHILTDLNTARDPKNEELPWSRELNSKIQRLNYLKKNQGLLPLLNPNRLNDRRLSSVGDEQQASGSSTAALGSSAIEASGVESANQTGSASDDPSYVPSPPAPPAHTPMEDFLFPGVDFSGFSPRINTLGTNAKKIRISQLADVAGILLRVTLDLCVLEYLERHSKKIENRLDKDLRSVLFHLDPTVKTIREANDKSTGADLHRAFTRVSGQDGFAVRTMHGYVHGVLNESSPSEVRALSRVLTPVLNRMSAQLANGHEANKEA